MPAARAFLALALAGILTSTLAACNGPTPPGADGTSTPTPGPGVANGTAAPNGERIGWHIEANDTNGIIPSASTDTCGGDMPLTRGFLTQAGGTSVDDKVGESTDALLVVEDTDTAQPHWHLQWDTSDDPYTATHYAAYGEFEFEYGPDGEPTGGHGDGAYFEAWLPNGDVNKSTDGIRVSMVRQGAEPETCASLEAQGLYTYH